MAKKPSTKRVMGALPPRGENSLKARAMIVLPRIRPMISGRMYWTAAAESRPRAPTVSRMKQAMQKPMLPGFPRKTRSDAMTPMTAPPQMIATLSLPWFMALPSRVDVTSLRFLSSRLH